MIITRALFISNISQAINDTMNILKITYAFFASTIVCGLLSCSSNQESAPVEADEHTEQEEGNLVALTFAQSKNAGIELGKVEQKQISGTIKVNGLLDVPPQQLVSISVPLGGFIKHTSLLQGSKVRKG